MPLPLSAQELCRTIREGHDYDPARLDRVLGTDVERGLIEVQSGALWTRLAAHLRPGDTTAQALCAARATVGESVASNAAGPDGRPIVGYLQSFTLVTPDGHLRRIDRIGSPELFALVVGGQGLFGALYSVTLRLDALERAAAEARAHETLMAAGACTSRRLRLLVPPVALGSMLEGCRSACAEWRVALRSLQLRHTRADLETFLRWAGREYAELSLGLDAGAALGAQVRHLQLRRSLIDLAIALGGAFPIACTPEATRTQTAACYPQLGRFLEEQRRIDPHGRWVNAWWRRQRSLFTREPCEVRWGR